MSSQAMPPERCDCGVISHVSDAEEYARLKAMGLCLGRRIELVKAGNPLIVKVFGSRIGLSARMARDITVTRCEDAKRCWERTHIVLEEKEASA